MRDEKKRERRQTGRRRAIESERGMDKSRTAEKSKAIEKQVERMIPTAVKTEAEGRTQTEVKEW